MSKTEQRKQAKELYVDQGMSGLEAAATLNISTTHFYRWVRQYGWNAQRANKLFEQKIIVLGLAVSIESAILDFESYLNDNYPLLAVEVKPRIKEFLQQQTTNPAHPIN